MSLYEARVPHKLANAGPALVALICKYIADEHKAGTLKAKKTKGEESAGWNILLSNDVVVGLISEYLLTEHNINVNSGVDGFPNIDEKGAFTVNVTSADKSILTNDLGLHVSPAYGPN